MRKFSKKVLALALVLSLGLSGMTIGTSVSKAAEVNPNEILPNVVDSNMDIPVTETNAFGDVIGEDKGITVSLDYDKMYAEGEDKTTTWSYRHKFELKQDAYVDITSFTQVFAKSFGDCYIYLSNSQEDLGIQLHYTDPDGDTDSKETTQKALAKGIYYITIVINKDSTNKYGVDIMAEPFYTINVKQTVPTNLSTNKVHLLNLNADAYVLEEKVTGSVFLPNYPETNSAIFKLTIPQECTLKFTCFIRNNSGEYYYKTNILILDSNLEIIQSDIQEKNFFNSINYSSHVYEQKVKAGDYYIKMTRGYEGATVAELTYWTEGIVTAQPTPTPVPKKITTTNTNTSTTNTQKVSTTKKTIPYISTQFVGKSSKKIKFTASPKLKGINIKFKWKGKTYKAKTNKKGVATITVKKKFINGKKIKVTYSKNGYKTKKSTYTFSIFRF